MIGRRSLLSLFGAAAGSAASGVSVKDLASLAAQAAAVPVEPVVPPLPTTSPDPWEEGPNLVRIVPGGRQMMARIEARRAAEHRAAKKRFPPHIKAMRSWSPTYKAHVLEKEIEAERALNHAMWDDDLTSPAVRALAKALGVELPA